MNMSIVSILLALMMSLNMMGGLVSQPVTMNSDTQVNQEGFESLVNSLNVSEDDSSKVIINLVSDILNALDTHLAADGHTLELSIQSKDTPILTLGVQNNDGTVTAVSSLLNGMAVSASAELMSQLMSSAISLETPVAVDQAAMTEAMNRLSGEEGYQDLQKAIDLVVEDMKAAAGEFAEGTYEVEGEYTFTKRADANITDTAVLNSFLTRLREFYDKDYCKTIFSASGLNVDKELDAIQARIDKHAENSFETAVVVYENEDGETFAVIDLARPANEKEDKSRLSLHLGLGTESKWHRAHFDVDIDTTDILSGHAFIEETGKYEILAEGDATVISTGNSTPVFANGVGSGNTHSWVISATTQGLNVRAVIDGTNEEIFGNVTARILVDDKDGNTYDLGTVTYSITEGAEFTQAYAGDETTVISLDEAMSGKDTSELESNLTMALVMGAMNTVVNLTSILPEDSAEYVNNLVTGFMSGGLSY